MSLIWDQTGTKLGPKGYPSGSLGVPWGSLGGLWGSLEGSLRDQPGTQLRSGTGPAPGTPKVPKVCNCRHKQAQGQTGRDEATPDFGTP